MSPRVSVVIATFNRSAMLRCALRSVLGQTVSDLEVLVVGDCCTDDSAEVVAAVGDPRIRWWNRTACSGSQARPNNDALVHAQGAYVAFHGHDDLWLPWHLEALLARFPGVDFAHAMVAQLGPDGVRSVFAAPPAGEGYRTHFVPPSGWMVRKGALDAVGGFRAPEGLVMNTDFDLQRRLVRAGCSIGFVPRLGVLKFPSGMWRAYAADAALPQAGWLDAIARDALGVERDVLTGAVQAMTAGLSAASPARDLGRAWRAAAFGMRDRLDGSLLTPVAAAWFRRRRAQARRRRGL